MDTYGIIFLIWVYSFSFTIDEMYDAYQFFEDAGMIIVWIVFAPIFATQYFYYAVKTHLL